MTDLSAGECLVRLTGRADTPHTRLLRSFPFRTALRSVIDSATPAVQGSLFDGECAGASGLFHWYRVSSCLLNHDPDVTQARCSPEVQRNAYSKPCTHDDYTHLVTSFHSLRSPVLSLHSGVSVL